MSIGLIYLCKMIKPIFEKTAQTFSPKASLNKISDLKSRCNYKGAD
jgi:hypothetical protein